MAKFRKKPTINELANVILELRDKLDEAMLVIRNLDNVIGLYIKMNGHLDEFNKYIEKEMERRKEEMNSDKSGNETANEENIQTDSKNERSGTKGIRKKSK